MNTEKQNKVVGIFGLPIDSVEVFRTLIDKNAEMNMFCLPEENSKDSVKQIDNFFIHQYALAEQSAESRINEILRDMLAIHADYYFISQSAPFYNEVYKSLVHYGYKVVVM